MRLEGVDRSRRAAAFTKLELLVPRAVLPPLEPGEYYVADLVGCAVVDAPAASRGVVTSVYWNGTPRHARDRRRRRRTSC